MYTQLSPATDVSDTTDAPSRAKLFMHGRSQAVRLPKAFRFEGTEVFVRRVGEDVVLSKRLRPGMQTLVDAVAEFEPGFVIERAQPSEPDERAPMLARGAD